MGLEKITEYCNCEEERRKIQLAEKEINSPEIPKINFNYNRVDGEGYDKRNMEILENWPNKNISKLNPVYWIRRLYDSLFDY